MSELKFRTLFADEIECRVQTVVYNKDGAKGCSILLYKDARCDMNILDETVGPEKWQRAHELINGNLFCNVGIFQPRGDGFGDWVWKQDVGTESNTEKEKGQASDSFKRACVNWGIGRELYTAPFIWIDGDLIEWKEDKNKKIAPKTTFYVDYIDYDDKRRICALAIKTNKGTIVWTMGKDFKKPKKEPKPKEEEANMKSEETKPVEVLCPICDKPVKRTRANGVIYEPMDVLQKLGGMCPNCYKKMKDESANS